MNVLEVKDLKKTYISDNKINRVEAIKGINLNIKEQDYIAVMGESGSGKSTLLNILAGLDKASSGSVKLNGIDMQKLGDDQICKFRREYLGFVFQDFNLLDVFSNKENIMLPMVLAKKDNKIIDQAVKNVAKILNIEELLDKYPYEVSGGQKQRIAVARALINDPSIILADEPTGALDSKNSEELLNIFDNLNANGNTILMVTHSVKAAAHAKKVLFIRDGKIYHELYKGEKTINEMYQTISNSLSIICNGGELND